MAIMDKWNAFTESIENGEHQELKNLVELINSTRGNETDENYTEIETEYEKTGKYLKSLSAKTYDTIDKAVRTQMANLYDSLLKKKGIDKSKWELFIERAEKKNWKPVLEIIELSNKMDKSDVTAEMVEEFERAEKSIRQYIDKNLTPYDNDWVGKEFAKKKKILRNKVARVIEEDFGHYIKTLRKNKGFSLKDLEDATGVTASYINRIENGTRKTPSLPIAEKLAKGLGVNPKELFEKLNFAETETENKEMLTGFTETVALSNFTINGKKATKDQKQAIMDIFKAIMVSEWTSDTMLKEQAEIGQLIGNFKKMI